MGCSWGGAQGAASWRICAELVQDGNLHSLVSFTGRRTDIHQADGSDIEGNLFQDTVKMTLREGGFFKEWTISIAGCSYHRAWCSANTKSLKSARVHTEASSMTVLTLNNQDFDSLLGPRRSLDILRERMGLRSAED